MQAQPDPADSLVFECDFDEPPQKVWRALTEPHLLDEWLAEDGGAGSGAREVHSTVTVELGPGPAGGTRLRLTHGEFRIVSAAPSVPAARVRPIMSARRRTRAVSFGGLASWRRAA